MIGTIECGRIWFTWVGGGVCVPEFRKEGKSKKEQERARKSKKEQARARKSKKEQERARKEQERAWV